MFRSVSTSILFLAGGALGVILLCLLALKLFIGALITLSGYRRQGVRNAPLLDW